MEVIGAEARSRWLVVDEQNEQSTKQTNCEKRGEGRREGGRESEGGGGKHGAQQSGDNCS